MEAKPVKGGKAGGEVKFKDRAFKSRTLITPDGGVVVVEGFVVTTSEPAVIQYLEQHPEFTREE